MTRPVDNLLTRLDRVKPTGHGRWQSRCPSHNDKGPSLSIRELEDGRVLVHCFAGCSVGEVTGALGLEIRDLFPSDDRPTRAQSPDRRPWFPADAFDAIVHEVNVVAVIVRRALTEDACPDDLERLVEAAERLLDIRDAAYQGRRASTCR